MRGQQVLVAFPGPAGEQTPYPPLAAGLVIQQDPTQEFPGTGKAAWQLLQLPIGKRPQPGARQDLQEQVGWLLQEEAFCRQGDGLLPPQEQRHLPARVRMVAIPPEEPLLHKVKVRCHLSCAQQQLLPGVNAITYRFLCVSLQLPQPPGILEQGSKRLQGKKELTKSVHSHTLKCSRVKSPSPPNHVCPYAILAPLRQAYKIQPTGFREQRKNNTYGM
ncbi:hypothetical protein FVR03_17725 [Pontibacter qinzhouensis]|uniref:Uncharacterized protein n=1 Tax=Pontibacter qinzhouensis TaxID=2603253 RepID=A0A5C8JGE8_9BACT|nr:hypothetical protein [Pontibacter qinzhouensis]TXK36451.1 hypothetical protein FVR03_17725 [Pontibacter qinzhouensis]